VVLVTLTTGTMFLLFTCVHFCCGEFYEGGPPMKLSTAGNIKGTVQLVLILLSKLNLKILLSRAGLRHWLLI
jgi:hypothetical protein